MPRRIPAPASSLRRPSPIGELLLVADDTALCGLFVADHEDFPTDLPDWSVAGHDTSAADTILRMASMQLDEYFAGTRTAFDVPLRFHGTDFQQTVWRALLDVGYGETASYGELARRIGRESASRAVGGANGRNPISIIVPCHRVIGSSGGLTGYGWGTGRKRWLLDHERGRPTLLTD